jgi:hypothetical protein
VDASAAVTDCQPSSRAMRSRPFVSPVAFHDGRSARWPVAGTRSRSRGGADCLRCHEGGRFRSWNTRFTRGLFGRINLEDTFMADESFPAYLAPLCEVWGLPIPRAAELDTSD